MGGRSDISGLLGGALGGGAEAATPTAKKVENTDYGLYAFGNGRPEPGRVLVPDARCA
jgi:hypothetical protein